MPVLEFDNVKKSFFGVPVLHGVSFELIEGQILGLVGENGSGKTTIIKLLTRLYQPSQGHITLDGLDLREYSEESLRERLGVIFQDFVHYQFKVGENINNSQGL